jgi:hypothetical protein
MSYKVHFIKQTDHNKKKMILSSEPEWLKYTKKDMLIQFITKRKWSSKSSTELQKYTVGELREKMFDYLKRYGTLQDLQTLEEGTMKEKTKVDEKKSEKREQTRQQKEKILALGMNYFRVGEKVWLFDEKPLDKYGRVIRKLSPIQVKVVDVKNDAKIVIVEFLETRPWYEAGGHWVQKGQKMMFKFDPVTCTWLREGLTPEVVRSYGPDGKSKYFELSYTRQYLLLPSSN